MRVEVWTLSLVGVVGGVMVVAQVAGAQGEGSTDGPVLHEYLDEGPVPSGESESGSAGGDEGTGSTSDNQRGGDLPTRRATDAEGTPGLTMNARGGEVIFGPDGPAEGEIAQSPYGSLNPKSSATKLDDKTDRVGDLSYHAAFEPSVFPYKRVVSQNQPVRQGEQSYGLATRRGQLEVVGVGGRGGSDEDTFWGSFLIRAEPGKLHPVPSVAPHQSVLRLQSEPAVEWQVLKDEAGNFYLQSDHRGVVRINMKVAVPVFYFSGEFTGVGGWARFPEVYSMSRDIESVAERVAGEIGVSRQETPAEVVETLVYYFRNFETTSLPERLQKGDRYYNIATSQIGVCRHRSLAFVITARHLGIPARYIYNEAHAFVEVYWPQGGWRRIDLGGAARDIGYQGGGSDSLHARSSDDPLPKPPAYRRELERLERLQDKSGREDAPEGGGRPSREASGESSGGSGSETQMQNRVEAAEESPRSESLSEESRQQVERIREGQQGGAQSGGASTELTVSVDGSAVYRGESVTVRGRLTSEGQPVGGERVFILFGSSGSESPEEMQRIGRATTDNNGRYSVQVEIPRKTEIGRWRLMVEYPGSAEFEGAVGR